MPKLCKNKLHPRNISIAPNKLWLENYGRNILQVSAIFCVRNALEPRLLFEARRVGFSGEGLVLDLLDVCLHKRSE